MEDLIALSARAAVARLKSREISPLDLIDAAARRIAASDEVINALPTLCLDRARDRAKQILAAPPGDAPPFYLYGLPVAIKDLTEVAGVRTTYGSVLFEDHVPDYSNLVVERLEANGAIVVAKSNTPEFGAGANTFNDVFGTTRNPWDPTKTAGGSSGGSAAALAAGQVWLASGSDLGGSLRIPASYCGVVGFRPSPGRVAHAPAALPFDTLSVDGPMARSVADLALMLDAMAGDSPRDPISIPRPARAFAEDLDLAPLPRRIAFSADLGVSPVESEVAEICEAAAARLGTLGVRVEADCIDLADAESTFQTLRAARFAATFGNWPKRDLDRLKPEIIWNIEAGLGLTAGDIGKAEIKRGELFQRGLDFFERYDLLLCPTVAAAPFDHSIRYLTEIEGRSFDNYVGWLIMTFAITLLACPALSLPCGFTKSGLPVGLQIVGPPRGDRAVLAAANAFERVFGLAGTVPIPSPPTT